MDERKPEMGGEHIDPPAVVVHPPTPSPPPESLKRAWEQVATDAHDRRSQVFPKTRAVLRYKNSRMYLMSSRGAERENYAPTQQTRPPLLKRRYSIDALPFPKKKKLSNYESYNRRTDCVDQRVRHDFETLPFFPVALMPLPAAPREMEEPVSRAPSAAFPTVCRYPELTHATWVGNVRFDHRTFIDLPKSCLSNTDFRVILDHNGPDAWWSDPILDAALELISLRYNVEEHKIFIASSLIGQILYPAGIGEEDETGVSYVGLSEYRTMMEDKHWIFIPINDGYTEQDASVTRGNHWSLIVVDRIHRVAHYVDSLWVKDYGYQNTAYTIAAGVGRVLGEGYHFSPEVYTPHQWRNNSFKGDSGPCGPFVVTMIKQYVCQIISTPPALRGELSFSLPREYQFFFEKVFDSRQVRLDVHWALIFLKKRQWSEKEMVHFDAKVLDGSNVELVEKPRMMFNATAQCSKAPEWQIMEPSLYGSVKQYMAEYKSHNSWDITDSDTDTDTDTDAETETETETENARPIKVDADDLIELNDAHSIEHDNAHSIELSPRVDSTNQDLR
ncbi:hypothetical protein P280DRAFT_483145 [Massarina eburnea CBS 473.64]|uniref:Ubiquitin-like protease family profile domain-containing protein n=1 Tax=Massarina eburnea CBS 473.64 TaxID=1395130 RepID=A0A6A6RPJ7_9PLEO|nr:hypothetical protein P280DRAFT_483145 [Massarina eburnea CBS 473.64]